MAKATSKKATKKQPAKKAKSKSTVSARGAQKKATRKKRAKLEIASDGTVHVDPQLYEQMQLASERMVAIAELSTKITAAQTAERHKADAHNAAKNHVKDLQSDLQELIAESKEKNKLLPGMSKLEMQAGKNSGADNGFVELKHDIKGYANAAHELYAGTRWPVVKFDGAQAVIKSNAQKPVTLAAGDYFKTP